LTVILSIIWTHRLIDWSDIPFLTLSKLEEGHELKNTYDVILIDEAQDFAPSWIKVVKALLKPDGTLFMCDDPNQSMFRFFSWREKGVPVVGRTKHLRVPFRSTREITQVAHSLFSVDSTIPIEEAITPDLDTYELVEGDKPRLIECRTLDEEVKFVEQTAFSNLAEGIPASQIAILCHSRKHVKYWAHLRTKGFYVEHFDKMKGLEFKVVLIPQLQTSFQHELVSQDEFYITEKRKRIFTAMTRARDSLMLSYHGNTFPEELAAIEPYIQREKANTIQPRR
jgi:superfamily I DNA/RNA helicase